MAETKHAPTGALWEALFLAREEAANMVVSIRAVFLVVTYAVIAGAIGTGLLWAYERLNQQMGGRLGEATDAIKQTSDLVPKLIEGGVDPALARAMVEGDLPWLVVGVLYFSTFAIPWLILLVGYNRISEDIQSKYTRFLLQRVHRGSYLAGKIVGHWLASLLAIIVVHGMLLAYAAATDRFDVVEVLKVMPRVWLSMALFVLAYSTFTCMVSSVLTPPFLVLLVGTMALFMLKFSVWIGSFFYAPIGDAWIGTWDVALWNFDPRAVAVYAGYSLVFIGLAYFVLRRRDL
jgi:ABC-type transport system involved in multi-copper enzyme maturation permease subunit